MRRFNGFRPVFEAGAAAAWGAVIVHSLWLTLAAGVDRRVTGVVFLVAGALCAWRSRQAMALWRFKLRLAGDAPAHVSCEMLDRASPRLSDQLWLGWGFRWQPSHAELCHDVLQRPVCDLYPPAWILRLIGRPTDPSRARGLAWVQGLDTERDVVVPLAAMDGHTAVLAVTGALKTVLARLLVYQLARRGDTVIVLDPKGDRGLEQVCRDVASRLGQPDRFQKLHPAFPSQSFRYDPLGQWDRETQVASRMRLLMGGEDDAFNAFVWTTVTDIVRGMARLGRRATLRALLDTVRSREAAEALTEAVLRHWFSTRAAAVGAVAPVGSERASVKRRFGSAQLAHWVDRFHVEVPVAERPSDIVGLIASLDADPAWFAKMIVGLVPVLMRLTAGDLGPLLSPDATDPGDARPIRTLRQLIDGGHIVYFGLDALSDTPVAEGLAALVLSDLAATAGDLYTHGPGKAAAGRRIHVLCDEWGDLVCEPVIQLANKGRGAGVVLYLFGQTVADLVVRLGDEARAKRVLGNMNNFIIGATSDPDTLDFITRKLGDTTVRRAAVSQSTGQKSEHAGLEYAATRHTSLTEQVQPLVPPQVLAGLPDLHYVAVLNRAQVVKGRIPLLALATGSP